jgi:hypothetical protein
MENNTINKPLSMVLQESKENLIKVINGLNLHPSILELLIKDIYNEVRIQTLATENYEKLEYEKALMENNKDSE